MTPRIRVGIGGWNFAPWRSNFYPEGLPQTRELGYAAERLTAIEVNSTYYSSQKPATFAKWRDAAPEGFVFSLKASRYATQRRHLAEAGESVERFVGSGIAELGNKLGPIVWQLPPTKAFDPDDLAAFLALLPSKVAGLALRHVLEVRHPSFAVPAYVELARRHHVATVFTDAADRYPSLADATGGLVYARLMCAQAAQPTGYSAAALAAWADRARQWAQGKTPPDLPVVSAAAPAKAKPQDVFVFFINGAKERAPAAAMALIDRLGAGG
ncbi:DUF72 domain-containing protein [Aquincola sp. MAHUQ-54]|uniref:DUF72 domain-containing protein n=1 Tax=Aquincola agrisoli TaxID=3119538 RepID=A0AAW9QK66_9BURK